MYNTTKYVGLDVSKEKIAIADEGRKTKIFGDDTQYCGRYCKVGEEIKKGWTHTSHVL